MTDTYSLTEFEDKVEEETVTEIDVTEDLVEDDEIIEIFSTLQQKIDHNNNEVTDQSRNDKEIHKLPEEVPENPMAKNMDDFIKNILENLVEEILENSGRTNTELVENPFYSGRINPDILMEKNLDDINEKNPENLEVPFSSNPKKCRKISKPKRNFGSGQPRRQNGKP